MYCFYYQLFINRLFAFCKTRYPLLPVIVFNQRLKRHYVLYVQRFLLNICLKNNVMNG